MKKVVALLLSLALCVSVLGTLPPIVPDLDGSPAVPGIIDHQNSSNDGTENPGIAPQSDGEDFPIGDKSDL